MWRTKQKQSKQHRGNAGRWWDCARTCGALAILLTAPGHTAPLEEYTAKAGFIFNFLKFIDWPATAFLSESDPFQLCVVSPEDVTGSFRSLEKHTAKGRAIKVTALEPSNSDSADTCNILFFTEAAEHSPDILRRLRSDRPVLIIGETPHFARDGGMINFVIVDNRVKFEINIASARARHLNISSKLSSLAVAVFGEGGAGE